MINERIRRVMIIRTSKGWKDHCHDLPQELQGVYHNGQCPDACDMLDGPCACGASHHLEEWPDSVINVVWKQVTSKRDRIAPEGSCDNEGCHGSGSDRPCPECQQSHEPNELTKVTLLKSEQGEDVEIIDSVDKLMEELVRPTNAEQQRFQAYMEEASAIVATWPKWKQEIARQITAPM